MNVIAGWLLIIGLYSPPDGVVRLFVPMPTEEACLKALEQPQGRQSGVDKSVELLGSVCESVIETTKIE